MSYENAGKYSQPSVVNQPQDQQKEPHADEIYTEKTTTKPPSVEVHDVQNLNFASSLSLKDILDMNQKDRAKILRWLQKLQQAPVDPSSSDSTLAPAPKLEASTVLNLQ